jgi:CBS domain-containing protein
MKGQSIATRIADFLKDHPPFTFLQREDIVELAAGGRVKFHEDGEFVFIQGQPRDRFIYVVQQGRLRVIEETPSGERLIDMRGTGDLIGLQGIRSEEPYLHTCRTESECILYALPRAAFTRMIDQSAEARRYLAAYFTLSPAYQHQDELPVGGLPHAPVTLRKGGLYEVEPPQATARNNLVTVLPTTAISTVARCLQSKRVDCVLIVDEQMHPLGKLTDADLRDRLIEGGMAPGARAGDWMNTQLALAHPSDNTGQLLIKLIRSGKQFLVVTADGTARSPVVGLVSERNLFLHYGRFPTVIGQAISSAHNHQGLRVLRDRIEALILEFIEDRASLPWLMEVTSELNRQMIRRALQLAEADVREAGIASPGLAYSWLMMGSGGRGELMIRSAVYHALVYQDPEPTAAEPAAAYFHELARRTHQILHLCGFPASEQGVIAANPEWCQPLSALCAKFEQFIRQPVETRVYLARDAFDFQPVDPLCPLAAVLRASMRAALAANPAFIRHMAADSLQHQPPRTIFQGYVIDKQGMQTAELAIKFHAILPLVDVARVLALEFDLLDVTSTRLRLEAVAQRIEATDSKTAHVLREAASAALVAVYARTSIGLRTATDGAVIDPRLLAAETRAMLITAFRNILQALEVVAQRHQLHMRD